LFLDAGVQGVFSSGHGHADALSVQFACGGRLWLADPGAGCYMGNGARRDRFRGTAAHNTVTVDGLDQAVPGGPFSWGPLPRVEVARWISQEGFDLLEARHSGYERLAQPVTHRRWVVRAGSFWLIRDVLEGSGVHDFDSRWHFSPGIEVCREGSFIVARQGGEAISLIPLAGAWACDLEEGEDAPVYGRLLPAAVVRMHARMACPAETAIVLTAGSPSGNTVFCRSEAPGVAAYQYAVDGVRHLLCFARGSGPWSFGEWTSDAAFFCCTEEEPRRLSAAGATFVDRDGERLLSRR
jgi:hypothetical protein